MGIVLAATVQPTIIARVQVQPAHIHKRCRPEKSSLVHGFSTELASIGELRRPIMEMFVVSHIAWTFSHASSAPDLGNLHGW